jgi:hypothetical protein
MGFPDSKYLLLEKKIKLKLECKGKENKRIGRFWVHALINNYVL